MLSRPEPRGRGGSVRAGSANSNRSRRSPAISGCPRLEAAEIREDAAGQPQFLRHGERHAERNRADIVFVAAQRIIGDRIARPDAGVLKAAQIVAADKKAILDQHLLAAPAENVAGL